MAIHLVLRAGRHSDYWWFDGEAGAQVSWRLAEAVASLHAGHRLAVTAFDSSPLYPAPEEIAEGWSAQGALAVSPELRDGLAIPHAGFDEWYVLDEHSSPEPEPEVFVNFGSFTVVPVAELEARRDPTWGRHALDWLVPLQQRFWAQIERIRPLSYIAVGDADVIVTRHRPFVALLQSAG